MSTDPASPVSTTTGNTYVPRRIDEYIGQDRIRENLQVSIAAARGRREALDQLGVHDRRHRTVLGDPARPLAAVRRRGLFHPVL